MQDLIWVGLVVVFFRFSGWFVGFADRLMPPVRRHREEALRSEPAERVEVRA